MDQLKGKVVNVVLTIQEGKGIESSKNLTFISANFNGRILESDPVTADDSPLFNTNLIWEIEKKQLRKIRSSNQPLRVECLSIDTQNRREKFGHVLLDLRSAQIVENPDEQVPFRWQKLIGVRNRRRNCIPELFLSLTIRNHLEVEPQESIEEIWKVEPREGSTPIKYLEDGYIMVGDENLCTEDFSLNIVIKSASSLDLLLPEVLVFHQNNNKYHMAIKIFGIPIKTKQFSKDLHDRIIFEEKIVVRLLSNLQILQQFFNEEQFEVSFNCSNDVLGVTKVSFDGLTNINEKLVLTTCYFRFPSTNGIVPSSKDGRKPSLALEIFLIQNKESLPALLSTTIEPHVSKASGDHQEAKQQLILITEEQLKELDEWKERQKVEFKEELQKLKEEELGKERQEIEQKREELNESIKKCKELQDDLQEKLNELKVSKALKKKRKSSTNLCSMTEENQKKFADCDKELLIDYITKLQSDNENLKQIIAEHKQELENSQRTALTKEQTTNLLQELKGLEEKFEEAQQTKSYFKEQWQKACQEIHNLKTEDYRQLQDQLRERREELLCIMDEPQVF